MSIAETENDKYIAEMGYSILGEYMQAVKLAAFDPNEQVFDVATGSGRMASTLSQAGYNVLSGDIDPDALERAKARLKESGLGSVKFIDLDASDMAYDGEFASVMCANAIHHFADPILVISEMAKACADSGKLVIMEFNTKGFEVMEILHKDHDKGLHERSAMDSQGIESQLKLHFVNVECHSLTLNNVWIASGKKPASDK
ncbi:class I SAM-dependent methyltransferase [bacterium]|nr:class I SAM-dependent methyltransferase [bacterium]